ncbi:MAG: radical SAM protein [Roseburia sp. 1XD42-69]|jgi:DNA repair photolyase
MNTTKIKQDVEFLKGIDPRIEIHSHGNTKYCNPNMMELNPAIGCQFQCQYCNAYTQEQENCFSKVRVFVDFPKYLEIFLKENKKRLDKIFFYFSPKIDAFQDCLLESGITKNILELLLEHQARYFIVTKGKIPNKEIQQLLIESKNINQLIISCTMPNEEIREILEPNAARIKERLDLAEFCVKNGIPVSAIFSPILPIDELNYVKNYIKIYLEMGITHFRVDFTEISRSSLDKLCSLLPKYEKSLKEVYLDKNATVTHWNVPYKEIEIERYWPSLEYMKKQFNELKNYAKSVNSKATLSVCNSLCIENKLHRFNDEAINAGFNCIGARF